MNHFAWSKFKLGWIDANQVDVVVENDVTEHHLTPIEFTGGTKMVIAPIGPYTAYIAESHRPMLNDETVVDNDVLLYKADLKVRSGHGPIKVIDTTPRGGSMPSKDLDHACFGIREGKVNTFKDAENKITIEVVEQTEKRCGPCNQMLIGTNVHRKIADYEVVSSSI